MLVIKNSHNGKKELNNFETIEKEFKGVLFDVRLPEKMRYLAMMDITKNGRAPTGLKGRTGKIGPALQQLFIYQIFEILLSVISSFRNRSFLDLRWSLLISCKGIGV